MKPLSVLRIALILSVAAIFYNCEPLSWHPEGTTMPLPLEVYPTADTLHVGDTLWIKANFSSQIQTDKGKTINADGAATDLAVAVQMVDNPTQTSQGHRIPCDNGLCSIKIPIILSQAGVFSIVVCNSDGGIFVPGKTYHDVTSIADVEIQYTIIPDKQVWYDQLCPRCSNIRKTSTNCVFYPFVVIN